ncbi:MAG TPA: hypothetical protein VFN26_22350 [Candidatus Acidoferrum sp.]|nr:hypothetical protein [Candidatus Acidoferrum sp.]
MAKQLSRAELYALVWSEPMKTLSARFGISDVALKKTCVRAEIPTPDRGYWAKKEAGKSTLQDALSARPPGMGDEVIVGGGGNYWHRHLSDEELLVPIPPPPEFAESIEAVRERIAKVVGKLTVPRDIVTWHPAIDRLLKEDDKRREKQLAARYQMSWDNPMFDAPIERRRLRILNTLLLATARMNGKPTISGREARSIHLTFYQQHVGIRLDRPKRPGRRGRTEQGAEPSDTKLCLSILESLGSDKERVSWQDDEGSRLESRLAEIAIQLILTAELQHRESAIRRYQWRVERKAQLEEEERERKLKAERAERERRKRLERARIERLLKAAAAFQQAGTIRKYVEAIRLTLSSCEACSPEELERWSQWALSEADRIDPAIGGAFLTAMRDEEGAQDGQFPSDE